MSEPREAASDRAPITVLVIDDHQMVAESMLRLLGDEPDIDVIGVAPSAELGLPLAEVRRPDVVVMDYALPRLDGVTAARLLREKSPETNVVLVTGSGGDDVLVAAIQAGCSGYLEKTQAFDELVRAVRLAAGGEIVLPPGELGRLLPKLANAAPARVGHADLSARERTVLELMGDGLANKAIARELDVRVNTVRNHVQNILRKLDAHSKLEAVAIATRRGLLDVRGSTHRDRV